MARGWFHCGRCGGLFQESQDKACPDCRGQPVVEATEFAFVQAGQQSLVSLKERPASAAGSSAGLDRSRSKGKPKGLAIFVTLWVVFLAGLVGLVGWMRSGAEVREVADEKTLAEQQDEGRFLNDAYQDCYQTLMGFLKASAPELRSQFVVDSVDTLSLMSRAADRAPVLVDEETPRMLYFQRFESPDGPAMESAWEMPDGERLEAVFHQDEEDAWKIDWANMIRYSSEPWSLFLSGTGPDVGEFRLLARRRANSTGGRGDVSRLMLLEPRIWDPSKTGLSSPEVQIDPGSEIGRQLKEAFTMREQSEGAFGTRLTDKDPKGMIRVNVVLRRSGEKDEHGEWNFEVEKLKACHWMAFDELGLSENE